MKLFVKYLLWNMLLLEKKLLLKYEIVFIILFFFDYILIFLLLSILWVLDIEYCKWLMKGYCYGWFFGYIILIFINRDNVW